MSNLVKISEIKGKCSVVTSSALTAVENKIPSVTNLVKKTDYDTKINELEKKLTYHIHDKYITTPELNKLTAENFSARLAQANLITKTDFNAKLSSFKRKITSNKTKHLLVKNELKKLKTFDLIYFCGKSHFEDDGTQNWFVFPPIQRYFKTVTANDSNIVSWKSRWLSDESIKPPTTYNIFINPSLDYVGNKIRIKFNGDCLKQEKITFNHGKIVNIYIVYEIEKIVNISSYPTPENCLFGAVKLTKHVDVDLYKYSGYGIGFDRKGFLFQSVMKLVEM